MGTSGNPQLAALLISMALPVTCYLVARPTEPTTWRIAFAAVAGLMVVMLLWTGSRTGITIAAMGIVLSFRARFGRFLAVGLIVGIFVLLAAQFYEESTASLAEMFTRGDTRSQVWSEMYQSFLNSPAFFGSMEGSYSTSENSYLATASTMGLFGLVPLFVFVAASLWLLYRLFLARRLLGSEKPFADLLIGSLLTIFVGANFRRVSIGNAHVPRLHHFTFISRLGSFAARRRGDVSARNGRPRCRWVHNAGCRWANACFAAQSVRAVSVVHSSPRSFGFSNALTRGLKSSESPTSAPNTLRPIAARGDPSLAVRNDAHASRSSRWPAIWRPRWPPECRCNKAALVRPQNRRRRCRSPAIQPPMIRPPQAARDRIDSRSTKTPCWLHHLHQLRLPVAENPDLQSPTHLAAYSFNDPSTATSKRPWTQ